MVPRNTVNMQDSTHIPRMLFEADFVKNKGAKSPDENGGFGNISKVYFLTQTYRSAFAISSFS